MVASLVSTGCAPPNVQQHAGFRRATVAPNGLERPVGQLVPFSVFPPVAKGTRWSLESHGLARFVGDDTGRIDWVANTTPIRMEAMVAPWGPNKDAPSGRGWLWFGMGEGAGTEPLDLDLPVHPWPYHEIAPVTYSSAFSIEPRKTRLSFERTVDRVKVLYRTPVESGVPYAPRIGAMLLETDGRKILYAEIKTNFGDRAQEPMGYDVTFSYAAAATPARDPVEVVVVEWIGHGVYYGPFDVQRLVVGQASEAGAKASATPSAEVRVPPPGTPAPAAAPAAPVPGPAP
ncbi:MAG TPA: hypothetical protein VF395_19600 [Polyangiaceae bacterium]